MYYPVCGMMHTSIKEPLLLIEKSSLCGDSGFPLSLSEWSFTICPTPYNRKNVLSASLNKAFPFLSWCDGSSDRSFMVDPWSYFSFQPVLHGVVCAILSVGYSI